MRKAAILALLTALAVPVFAASAAEEKKESAK